MLHFCIMLHYLQFCDTFCYIFFFTDVFKNNFILVFWPNNSIFSLFQVNIPTLKRTWLWQQTTSYSKSLPFLRFCSVSTHGVVYDQILILSKYHQLLQNYRKHGNWQCSNETGFWSTENNNRLQPKRNKNYKHKKYSGFLFHAD